MKFQTGIDIFFSDRLYEKYKKLSVSLICNHTTRNSSGEHIIDLCKKHGIKPAYVLTPEHGLFSAYQDMETVKTEIDSIYNIPIYSLYGSSYSTLAPSDDIIEQTELFIFDIQDVGSRYYTYVSTLFMLMKKLNKTDKKIIVFDRPNPINGISVEGNLIESGFHSFVGALSVPNRHGMTVGELALLYISKNSIDVNLTVIPVKNWDRTKYLDEYKTFYFYPSPNMPSVKTALLYPGMCLLEGTNLSEGRGTTRPFELIGAPFINARHFVDSLMKLNLPGVKFLLFSFRPMFQKWAGKLCNGVFAVVTSRNEFLPLLTGLAIILQAKRQAPDQFAWRSKEYEFAGNRYAIDLLFGTDKIRKMIDSGKELYEIYDFLCKDVEKFKKELAKS